jgi:hypothetical protein
MINLSYGRAGRLSYFRPNFAVNDLMVRFSLRAVLLGALIAGAVVVPQMKPAAAQGVAADAPMQITWEVRNRFRLFREERDFQLHVEALRDRNILSAEDVLEAQSDGRGWARNMVNRLCIDNQGRVAEPCTRDNVKESYLTIMPSPCGLPARSRSAPLAPGRSTTVTGHSNRPSTAPSP